MGELLDELKRRNVVRVGAAYLVVAWLVAQVAEMALPAFEAPAWILKVVLALLALGLPLALFFAWAFELTPDGVKKTADVDKTASVTASTGQKLNYITIALLILAVAWFAWDRQNLQQQVATAVQQPATEESVVAVAENDQSIAVLPFVNMSSDREQEWFADGLTEEILNTLVRASDLKVAARTSSFKFKNTKEDVPTIANSLGVGHVLEGSVRRGGDKIRITAQLIRARDGIHLWSQTYDSGTDDVIRIQEDVAISIAKALKTAMDPDALARMASAGTRSVPAYEAYLEGLAIRARASRDGDGAGLARAAQLFDQARILDSGFAAAHAASALYWLNELQGISVGVGFNQASIEESTAQFAESIDAAIAAAGNTPAGLFYRGEKAMVAYRFAEALENFNEYLRTSPNDRDALTLKINLLQQMDFLNPDLESTIRHRLSLSSHDIDSVADAAEALLFAGNTAAAVQLVNDNREQGVFSNAWLYQSHRVLLWDGQMDEAKLLLRRLIGTSFPDNNKRLAELRQACAEKDQSAVKRVATLMQENEWWWLSNMIVGREDAAYGNFPEGAAGLAVISGLLNYPYFDVSQTPEFEKILLQQGIHRPPAVKIPYACKPDTA